MAFLFTAGHCSFLSSPLSTKVPFAFVSPTKLSSWSGDNTHPSRSQKIVRKRVVCSLSQHAIEEDSSFFVRASEWAAKQRMQQLKDKTDNLAVSSSSSIFDIPQDAPVDGNEIKTAEGDPGLVTKIEGRQEEGEKNQPRTQKLATHHCDFQRRLLETRLHMETREKKANAAKRPELGMANSSSMAIEEAGSAQHLELHPQKTNTSTTTSIPLSSDGKQIFEPSPSSLESNEENIGKGILVLIRAYSILNSILDKKRQ